MSVYYLILVLCAGMALAAWVFLRSSVWHLPSISEYEIFLNRTPDAYRHIGRLFSQEDFAFLEQAPGGPRLISRLRRERRRLLRLLLADLRTEFRALLAVGSLLAVSTTAQDDGFAALLWKQNVIFHSNYLGLFVCSYLPIFPRYRFDPARLVKQIRTLRETTSVLMHALTVEDMDRLRDIVMAK